MSGQAAVLCCAVLCCTVVIHISTSSQTIGSAGSLIIDIDVVVAFVALPTPTFA